MPGGGAGELPGAEHETPEAAPGESPAAGRVRRTKPGRVDVEEAKRQRKAATPPVRPADPNWAAARKVLEQVEPEMRLLEKFATSVAKAAAAAPAAQGTAGGQGGDQKKAQTTKDSSQKGQEDNHPMMQHLEGLAAGAARATEQARRQGMNVPPPITADGDGPFPGFPAGSKQQERYEKYQKHWGSF